MADFDAQLEVCVIQCMTIINISQRIKAMSSRKCDIKITIKSGEESFRIGGLLLPNGRYAIKRGRSWSRKIPSATIFEIFSEARKWANRNARKI